MILAIELSPTSPAGMRRSRAFVKIESNSTMNEAQPTAGSLLTHPRNRMIFIFSAAGQTAGAAREERQ
jgi:hypothetical protein